MQRYFPPLAVLFHPTSDHRRSHQWLVFGQCGTWCRSRSNEKQQRTKVVWSKTRDFWNRRQLWTFGLQFKPVPISPGIVHVSRSGCWYRAVPMYFDCFHSYLGEFVRAHTHTAVVIEGRPCPPLLVGRATKSVVVVTGPKLARCFTQESTGLIKGKLP